MRMRFRPPPPDPADVEADYRRRANSRAHCPRCGRFARWVRGYWAYVGSNGSEYRTVVRCAACGEGEVY